ncbi:MAG TPA: HEAT repeat domain-containing protein [Oscillatoriales cyanobacterium M4454_W2019_049]|nr:HEAT repeat domain-containing protein [Oscillatoriales cyanobacterium M4454_W2019_049]
MTLARVSADHPTTPCPSETTLTIALEALMNGDFQKRWDAVKLFSQLDSQAIDAAIELLDADDDDWELSWFIARILGQSDRPQAIEALVELLATSSDEDVKTMAANTLSNFGERAIAPLTDLLAEPQWRQLAIAALARTQNPGAIEPLLSVAEDPDPAIRAAVLEALHAFRDPRILPCLVVALDDLSAIVRREATIGLGLHAAGGMTTSQELDLVKLLERRLSDFNLSVCQQAAVALSRCGTDAAARALFRVLQAPHTPVPLQVEIARSLSWIDSLLALEYLRQSLELPSPTVCLEAIRSIGQVSKSQYRSLCTRILLDWSRSTHPALQHPEIRQAIALELGRLGDSQALSYLQHLQKDPDPKVRIHAETAYQMVIGH